MDGKRRQYVPPALGGLPASTAATTAAAAAAEAAAKRLISLRNSARPPERSLPTQTSPNAQALREQAVADIRQCAPSLNSGSSQVFVPTANDGGHSDRATTTTAFVATGLPRTYRDDSLSLPRPRSYAAPPLASSASSSSPVPATVAAAAAAAALLKIRNRIGNSTAPDTVTSGHPSSSEIMPQSSSRHLTARPPPKASRLWTPPTLSLRRPPSAITVSSHPTGEAHERSYATTASANLSPQHVFLSSSSPTPPPSDALGPAVEPCREVLRLGGDAAGCSDVVGLTSVSQAGLKRPRDFDVPSISDSEDDPEDGGDGGHGGTIASSPASPRSYSSSSSTDKASAPPSMSNGVGAGLPRAPVRGEGLGEGSATRPLAAWRGLLPRPGAGDASTALQPPHPLNLASLQHAFPRLNRTTTASDEEAEQATFNCETEEDEDAVADDETGEEDGGGGRRSVVQSDPLRVVVDFAEVGRVAARSKTAAAAAASSDGALQQAEEAEAMLTDAQKGSESHQHAKQDNANRLSLEAERDARDVASARAFLEKRAWADVHRRATQAATTPAPPSELLLDLLQHLPSTPGRAIYDRSSCPPTAAASGFNEDFHKCVQQLMTQIVLQRDGRAGDAKPPSVSLADAAAAQQASASPRHRSRMQRKAAKQQKEGEVEQLVESVERGIADDVRDVVAYARFVVQERLHQEQRKGSERLSPPSKTAVGESEGNLRPGGDMQTPEQHQLLAELRAVVEKKLSLICAAAETTEKEGEPESATLRRKRAQSTGGSEDDANGIPGATDAARQDSKAVFVAAHTRFMDVVRSAAANRREKVEAAQAAEQRLEATVASWRKSYDKLLTRELSRLRAGKRPDKQSRTEALLQAMQPQQEKHQKRQHHQPPTGLWEMTKGMHKKERKHLNKLVKAAANVFPLPPFQYPPAPPHFSP